MKLDAASKRGLLAVLVGAVLATAYAFSFVFAQATPEPHELPIAVAGGDAGRVAELERRLETAAGESYDVARLGSAEAGREQLRRGKRFVVVLVGNGPVRFLAAPALGRGAVDDAVMELPMLLGLPKTTLPKVEEVRPLVREDPLGTALNLSLFPPIIVGIVVPILMLLLASALTLRRRLLLVAAFSILAGLGPMLMVNVVLGAVPGDFLALAGVQALLAFGVGACTTAAVGAFGPPGVGLSLLVFLIFGNVASGAAVTTETLPGAYRVIGPYLPPGAAADALRRIGYVDGAELLRPLLVLAAFCVAGAGLTLLLGGRRPAPQGDPAGPTSDQEATTA